MTYHIRGIAKDATNCGLNSSSGRVNVGLCGGGVLVRHDCDIIIYGFLFVELILIVVDESC